MGSLDRVKAHLKRATQIEAKFRLMALEDPDLEQHNLGRKLAKIRFVGRVRTIFARLGSARNGDRSNIPIKWLIK